MVQDPTPPPVAVARVANAKAKPLLLLKLTIVDTGAAAWGSVLVKVMGPASVVGLPKPSTACTNTPKPLPAVTGLDCGVTISVLTPAGLTTMLLEVAVKLPALVLKLKAIVSALV